MAGLFIWKQQFRFKNGGAFAECAEKLGLTAREAEIVRLILEGKDSRRITAELFISDHTVKNHIHHVYRKLGIRNRIQLARRFQSALKDYRYFLELWPNADAGRPEVTKARERVSALAASPGSRR